MTIAETCTVRPELMEFQEHSNEFLIIVAHQRDGFKFTKTVTTTAGAGVITSDLYYDTAYRAGLCAQIPCRLAIRR